MVDYVDDSPDETRVGELVRRDEELPGEAGGRLGCTRGVSWDG